MTVKLASLKANLDRESEGDWVEFPDWPGVAFKVRSLQTPAYRIARDHAVQRLNRQFRGKATPTDELSKAFGRLYVDHLLLNWRGLDVEYTPEAARETLTDPAYRDVVNAVEWCAARVGEAEIEFVEDAAKNSQSGSDTTSGNAAQTTS